ncbi:hypothetical protein [uncultured Victivallis sp.]|uniref:hypothetical protein n=1 Tax=uncultured Victivallis sp. TaxID=354118 RepID=UPI00259761BD|nr:hypothetical protein [uncultured Victivallis sp.]
MKIRKSVLLEALKVLGKVVAQTSPEVVVRSVRFVEDGERLRLMATDGVECVAVSVECEVAEAIDFAVEYRALRERIRSTRGGEVEVTGKSLEWPDLEEVPEEAVSVELPASFGELLALAAPIVDRDGARLILRGVNLSPEGITATNGKELLHLPCPLAIPEEVTLPFPLALLTAKPAAPGVLHLWSLRNERLFRLEIGGFLWQGKALSGKFPAWKQVIPSGNALDYSLEFFEPERIIAFLKTVPDHEPLNGIELNVTPRGVTLIPVDTPEMSFETDAEFLGVQPRAVLVLNKYILLRMLQQRYTKFRAHSDGRMPVVAEGGAGCYVAMPIHLSPKSNPQTNQETNKMENIENKVVSAPVQTVTPNHEPGTNPLDELYNTIDTFRNKLKLALDESTLLVRKVKEVQLAQKQKERDFIQAKRAIERIRMAI